MLINKKTLPPDVIEKSYFVLLQVIFWLDWQEVKINLWIMYVGSWETTFMRVSPGAGHVRFLYILLN